MILTLSCPDQRGIVAAVSTLLFQRGANILDAQQFDDEETSSFFMRVVFDASDVDVDDLRVAFADVAQRFSMQWSLRDPRIKQRVMLLAS
ncbi:ACT domain-containing protein, partial [Klebsiella pneumoniae]|nr:ACT domain-containing protein [Klebsiella pneumoniae]